MSVSRRQAEHSRRPYVLIESQDPSLTLAQGRKRYYRTVVAAANGFCTSAAPYKVVIHDDGRWARELNHREEQLMERVCSMLGYEIADA